MFIPRDYQQDCIDKTFDYWSEGKGDNPLVVLPTGGGKSGVQGTLFKDLFENYQGMRIVSATHVKELVDQNYRELIELWDWAPAGVYSAGLGRRELSSPILFAGIQSIYKRAPQLGHVDVLAIDEAHLVPSDGTGQYRTFIDGLRSTNPDLKIFGLTATPYRLKSGLLYEGDDRLDDALEAREEPHAEFVVVFDPVIPSTIGVFARRRVEGSVDPENVHVDLALNPMVELALDEVARPGLHELVEALLAMALRLDDVRLLRRLGHARVDAAVSLAANVARQGAHVELLPGGGVDGVDIETAHDEVFDDAIFFDLARAEEPEHPPVEAFLRGRPMQLIPKGAVALGPEKGGREAEAIPRLGALFPRPIDHIGEGGFRGGEFGHAGSLGGGGRGPRPKPGA